MRLDFISHNRKVIESGILCFFFQAEDGIRDLVRSRGLGDVYKRQPYKKRLRMTSIFIWRKNV